MFHCAKETSTRLRNCSDCEIHFSRLHEFYIAQRGIESFFLFQTDFFFGCWRFCCSWNGFLMSLKWTSVGVFRSVSVKFWCFFMLNSAVIRWIYTVFSASQPSASQQTSDVFQRILHLFQIDFAFYGFTLVEFFTPLCMHLYTLRMYQTASLLVIYDP